MRTIVADLRRFPAILLVLAFAALGSGLLEYVHARTHLTQHAAAPTGTHQQSAPDQVDPDGCALCAHLHVGRISAGWLPMMVCLGVFVAFLTQLSPRLAPQRVAARIDCRGPPVL